MGEKRTFTVDSSNVEEKGGRYTSKNPLSAAKKAASQLFKKAAKTKHTTKKQLKLIPTLKVNKSYSTMEFRK